MRERERTGIKRRKKGKEERYAEETEGRVKVKEMNREERKSEEIRKRKKKKKIKGEGI